MAKRKTTKKRTTTTKTTGEPRQSIAKEKKEVFRPKALKLKLDGMGSQKVWGLINYVAKKGEVYLEVGSYRGASLVAAAHNNPNTKCIGIDNFEKFNKDGTNEAILKEAIKGYDNAEYIKGEYIEVMRKLAADGLKIDCFFYDGPHDRVSVSNGLEHADLMLSESGYIIVDDTNWKEVADAVIDFCKGCSFEIIFQQKAKFQGDAKGWWNGVQVLKRKK